jgi:hypothetical protein
MSSSFEPPFINSFTEFEQHVAKLFHKGGWTVETPKQNQPGYDLVIKKGDTVAAVQVKWLKNNVKAPQLLQFADFLESDECKKFNYGFFITTKGYGSPALALIRSWGQDSKIHCGVASESKIDWIDGETGEVIGTGESKTETKEDRQLIKKIYFGVFTCKGGVGKTTVAAHLAGAFALQGFNVALVDFGVWSNWLKK